MNWDTLAESINRIVEKYNRGGEKEKMGRQSHDTVINALKAYQRFIESSKGSTSSYKPVEADQCISFFIKSKFIKDLLNALEVADKNFFENTNEAEGPVFEISEDVSSMRWHYPEENPLKPETVIKAVQCIPSENWLLHMCSQYGIDGPCQSIGTLSVPDAIFEYEFYFESDKYPEDITFEDVDNKIPMNIIGCALSPEGAKAFAENLPDGIKESLEPLTAFHLFEEVTGEIGIYLNVPAGNTSMSEKLENIFSKIDPTTYTLFVIPQTGFIDEWQFSNTFPGGMKAAIYGALEDMPFDFSLRQYC